MFPKQYSVIFLLLLQGIWPLARADEFRNLDDLMLSLEQRPDEKLNIVLFFTMPRKMHDSPGSFVRLPVKGDLKQCSPKILSNFKYIFEENRHGCQCEMLLKSNLLSLVKWARNIKGMSTGVISTVNSSLVQDIQNMQYDDSLPSQDLEPSHFDDQVSTYEEIFEPSSLKTAKPITMPNSPPYLLQSTKEHNWITQSNFEHFPHLLGHFERLSRNAQPFYRHLTSFTSNIPTHNISINRQKRELVIDFLKNSRHGEDVVDIHSSTKAPLDHHSRLQSDHMKEPMGLFNFFPDYQKPKKTFDEVQAEDSYDDMTEKKNKIFKSEIDSKKIVKNKISDSFNPDEPTFFEIPMGTDEMVPNKNPFVDFFNVMKLFKNAFFGNGSGEEENVDIRNLGSVREPTLYDLVASTLKDLKMQSEMAGDNSGFLLICIGGEFDEINDSKSPLVDSIKFVTENTDPKTTLTVLTTLCPNKSQHDMINDTIPIYANGPYAEKLVQDGYLYKIPRTIRKIARHYQKRDISFLNLENMLTEAKLSAEPVMRYIDYVDMDSKNKKNHLVVVPGDRNLLGSGESKRIENSVLALVLILILF